MSLPKPNDGFRWTQLSGGPALVCDPLEPFARHFFTSRPWRLGEPTMETTRAWDDVAAAAGVAVGRLRRLHQVHGDAAVVYANGDAQPSELPKADIALTNDPTVALAVQTADCLPILIVDRRTRAVAAAHGGWRGLAAGVPRQAIARLVTSFGARLDDLLIAIGPAIGSCCYEVGEDVRTKFDAGVLRDLDRDRWFTVEHAVSASNPSLPTLGRARPGHWFFDPLTCASEMFERLGVPLQHIFTAGLCTASHEAVFCSYRRDGAVAGRMAAVIQPRP